MKIQKYPFFFLLFYVSCLRWNLKNISHFKFKTIKLLTRYFPGNSIICFRHTSQNTLQPLIRPSLVYYFDNFNDHLNFRAISIQNFSTKNSKAFKNSCCMMASVSMCFNHDVCCDTQILLFGVVKKRVLNLFFNSLLLWVWW